jgi:hypothetical protein
VSARLHQNDDALLFCSFLIFLVLIYIFLFSKLLNSLFVLLFFKKKFINKIKKVNLSLSLFDCLSPNKAIFVAQHKTLNSILYDLSSAIDTIGSQYIMQIRRQ